jgi:hypothetical protein
MTSRHRPGFHHLSSKHADGAGWVEGITNLTEEQPATELLSERLTAISAPGNPPPLQQVGE